MPQKLTKPTAKPSVTTPLTSKRDMLFRIVLTEKLERDYSFKNMKEKTIKDFHRFLDETIGKKLTISQVDKMYLRTRGNTNTCVVNGIEYEEVHYGKDRKPFRVFGYYDQSDFILTKIDGNHNVHR